MTSSVRHDPVYRGLRALLGYLNLALAGVRPLSLEEERLAEDISEWWSKRG